MNSNYVKPIIELVKAQSGALLSGSGDEEVKEGYDIGGSGSPNQESGPIQIDNGSGPGVSG